MLTPEEGLVALNDVAVVETEEERAVLRERLDQELVAYAVALADAFRGGDPAGVKTAGKAIVDAVRAYQNALESGVTPAGGLQRATRDDG